MQAPASAAAKMAELEHIGAICDGRHDDHDDHDRARSQAVKAVGEVDGVAHAHEQDVHEEEVEPRDGDATAPTGMTW